MVKGTSKRVVVVKSPDPKFFEQAIFILREDLCRRGGSGDVLREAQRVADDYVRSCVGVRSGVLRRIPGMVYIIGAAVLAALAGLAAYLFI